MDLQQIKQKREELDNTVKEMFNSFLKEIFEKNSDIKLITWTQYTPYFNDGDPCEFNVHDAYVSITDGTKEEDSDYETVCCEGKYYSVFSAWECKDDLEKFRDVLDEIDNILSEIRSYLQTIFSDHSRIIVFKDKIVVETYDHD